MLRYKEPASGPWRGDKKPGAGLRYCATVTAPARLHAGYSPVKKCCPRGYAPYLLEGKFYGQLAVEHVVVGEVHLPYAAAQDLEQRVAITQDGLLHGTHSIFT